MGNGSLQVIPTGGLHSGAGPPAKRPLRRRKTRNCELAELLQIDPGMLREFRRFAVWSEIS